MLYLGLFFLELFSLFFFSNLLIKALTRLFYFISKSQGFTVHALGFLFLPGTIIHELSHVILANVMFVHTGEIEFMPEVTEHGVKLGSAEIQKTDPIRRSLIGIAPFLIGVSAILGSLFFFSNSLLSGEAYSFWVWAIFLYLLFQVSNTMFSSKKDLEGSLIIGVLITSIFVAAYLLGFKEIFTWFESVVDNFSNYIKIADLLLLIPIGVNSVFYLLMKLILRK